VCIHSAAALGVRLSAFKVGATPARCSNMLKKHEPQDCLDVEAANKWGVVVVVRERANRLCVGGALRSGVLTDLNKFCPKREIPAINLFNN
jgi:hypothetical protein